MSKWRLYFLLTFILLAINSVTLFAVPATRWRLADYSDWMMNGHKRGFVRRVYVDQTGVSRKYVVYVPSNAPVDQSLPLLVFLHGLSGNGFDGVNHIHECLGPVIWEQRAEFPFLVLFPQCPNDSSWSADDVAGTLAIELLEKTQREYGTDPDRVYLTGVSSGGHGAWSIGTRHADRFAAVIPISGTAPGEAAAETLANANLPIWSFYVRGDNKGLVTSNRAMQELLFRHGASPFFTELDGTLSENWWTHDAWSYAYSSRATFAWLLSQRRSRNTAQNTCFELIANLNLSRWTESGDADWLLTEDAVIVCKADDRNQGDTGELMYQNNSRNFELHLEFRCEGPQVCGFTFGTEQVDEDHSGWELQVASRDQGSGGLFNLSSGECLQSADAIAQGSFKDGEWNDLRIMLVDNQLTVRLNGWNLIELKDKRLSRHNGQFALVAGTDPSAKNYWRHVRIREVTP